MTKEERMPFDISTIDGCNIEAYLKNIAPFDEGADSLVYKLDDWVIHQYLQLGMPEILLYQRVTAEVARHAPKYAAQTHNYGTVKLKGEPITKIVRSQASGYVYSISHFAGGERGDASVDQELNRLLNKFSNDMNHKLGVNGIHAVPENTKLSYGLSHTTCTITDVCFIVRQLSPRGLGRIFGF